MLTAKATRRVIGTCHPQNRSVPSAVAPAAAERRAYECRELLRVNHWARAGPSIAFLVG
jgi:hypothetical protein